MRWTGPSTIAALLLASGVASAQEPAPPPTPMAPLPATVDPPDPEVVYPSPYVRVFADLTFVLDPKAVASCTFDGGTMKITTEEVFRLLVEARMVAAFKPDPRAVRIGRVRVEVSRIPGGLAGNYVWEQTNGVVESWRTVERGVTPLHCKEVLEGLAIGLAIDFDWIARGLWEKYRRKAAPPPVCTTPEPTHECPSPAPASRFDSWPQEWPPAPLRAPEPDPPKPPERPFAVRFGAGAWADYISNSGGSLGLTLDAGVRWGAFSVAGEGRWDPALGATSYSYIQSAGSVRFARATGALMLCAHHDILVGCLAGRAGRILFPGSSPALPTLSYAAAGVRVGLEFPVAPWFLVRLDGELLPTIDPATAMISNEAVFQVARLNAGLGLGGLFDLGKH
jgi:hypothetical protein